MSNREANDRLRRLFPMVDVSDRDFQKIFQQRSVKSKTMLLREGDVSKYMFFIVKRAIRMFFNEDGKEISIQFFFEDQFVSSFRSFRTGEPGEYSLETIEPCELVAIHNKDIPGLLALAPEIKDALLEYVSGRMDAYLSLFISRIRDSPEKRYLDLVNNAPHILNRVAQQHIASYLGITPVSLSRIRNRVRRENS